MSCDCGAQRMEDCVSLAELGSALTDPLRKVTDFTEPTWKRMAYATYCLLHPVECVKNEKARAENRFVGILLLGGLAWWMLHDR